MIIPKTGQVVISPIYDSDYFNPNSKLIKIPDSSKERCDQGIVVSLGKDCDPAFKIGDHVIFSGYTGTTIAIDGSIFIIMHNKFIKGVIVSENYRVSGVYFKGKVSEEDMYKIMDSNVKYFDYLELVAFLDKYETKRLIPAMYDDVANQLAITAQSLVADRVVLAPDEHREQRDEIDDDSV